MATPRDTSRPDTWATLAWNLRGSTRRVPQARAARGFLSLLRCRPQVIGSGRTVCERAQPSGEREGHVTDRAWCTIYLMGTKVDREQLRALVEPHWRRLYNFVFRLTLDRDRAERYLMDIFSLAATQLDRAPEADLELWLLGLANK